MSRLMIVLGIAVAVIGAATGVFIYLSPGQMQVMGLTPETAAVLLVGGLVLVGLGGVISSLEELIDLSHGPRPADDQELLNESATAEFSPVDTARAAPIPVPDTGFSLPGDAPFSKSRIEALLKKSDPLADIAHSPDKRPVSETIAALDKAKDDLDQALKTPGPDPAPAAEPASEEAEDSQLYVVEERLIRGRPARVLSDGTVEAETDEGWMRFENLEHLEEYLDAMSPGQA